MTNKEIHNIKLFSPSLLFAFILFILTNFFIVGNLFSSAKADSKPISRPKYVKIPIWGFHDIVDLNNKQNKPPYRREFDSDYSIQELEKFLEYLLKNNYWFLSTEEFYAYFLTNSKVIPVEYIDKKPVMLTFDDGYKGIKNNLLPLLEKLEKEYKQKIKVVLFINPGLMSTVDDDILYLSCEDLKEGFEKGFYDIQSHGLSHLKLTELNIEKLSFELSKAKFLLRTCINNKKIADHLAYPNGAYSETVEKYTKTYYLSAYAYDNQLCSCEPKQKRKYRIPRYQAYKKINSSRLIEITQKAFN